MKNLLYLSLMALCSFSLLSAQELITYDDIPGRAQSDHYQCRVKLVSEPDSAWRDVFVLQTEAKDNGDEGYFKTLRGWTASWIAFESDFKSKGVVVEISKKDGNPITKAMLRPVGDASPARVSNGKAYVTFLEPANVNVDINGQMEDQYTGYGYDGPDVHTITLFANPIFEKPNLEDPNVKVLMPNEDINTLDRDEWQTIVFAPGVHDIGMEFQILSDETLFIPGDAVVHGTIHPQNKWGKQASKHFKVYGSGTISGENIVRDKDDKGKKYKPFTYQAEGAHLEGFVVADPAFHTFNMGHSSGEGDKNIYKNLKILGWRVNSDGVNAFRNSEVSDCFFRVQDDAFYMGSSNVNQHDNVVWNDANGAVLFLQNIPDGSTNTFRDVKVIYHRALWHWWSGGRIVSMRQRKPGISIANVHVKNIFVEDPYPAFPPFYATMTGNGEGDIKLKNIVFENIHQPHDGVSSDLDEERGKPVNTMKGLDEKRRWKNITFKNCTFMDKKINSFKDGNFEIEHVEETSVIFENSSLD